MKVNKFPHPKRIGIRAVGWLADDIQNWIENLSLNSARGYDE